MYKSLTALVCTLLLVVIAACAKQEPNSPSLSGPELKSPVTQNEPAPPQAQPGADTQGVKIGDRAPAWTNLEGTDGKTHSLSDLADKEVVAVVFTCNHCPVAQAYEERLIKFVDDYKDKSVALVAINVNNLEDDKLPAMKERAEQKKFNFSYLYDPSQKIGRAYGAAVTPHAFVLDKNRSVVYIGPIEDNMDESAVQKRPLREAVDAALAGRMPDVTTMKPHGCSIKYD
jgi:peroxiredoxin